MLPQGALQASAAGNGNDSGSSSTGSSGSNAGSSSSDDLLLRSDLPNRPLPLEERGLSHAANSCGSSSGGGGSGRGTGAGGKGGNTPPLPGAPPVVDDSCLPDWLDGHPRLLELMSEKVE
eukprot:TRINITY_DN1614_c0_g1_i1.p3 TRINITY_DN1614_c0_g1~~TRINITY_DN1614_c0_g1_i1.p3  ORF type:complete len:120 (+),score=52.69 TRINITY_DN1614_c0_g1_i1:316-675(+)